MKAKVIAVWEGKQKTTVNNKPVKVGDVVEVDEPTYRNLARKEILGPHDGSTKEIDIEDPEADQQGRRLGEEDAKAKAKATHESREEKKEKANSKKQK